MVSRARTEPDLQHRSVIKQEARLRFGPATIVSHFACSPLGDLGTYFYNCYLGLVDFSPFNVHAHTQIKAAGYFCDFASSHCHMLTFCRLTH